MTAAIIFLVIGILQRKTACKIGAVLVLLTALTAVSICYLQTVVSCRFHRSGCQPTKDVLLNSQSINLKCSAEHS